MTPPPPAPAVAGRDADSAGIARDAGTDFAEPEAKRQRVMMTMCHVDVEPQDYLDGADGAWFQSYFEDTSSDHEPFVSQDDDRLWMPDSDLEPAVAEATLAEIDRLADEVEMQRLLKMKVLCLPDEYQGSLGQTLSTKMVRAWRTVLQVGTVEVDWWVESSIGCSTGMISIAQHQVLPSRRFFLR